MSKDFSSYDLAFAINKLGDRWFSPLIRIWPWLFLSRREYAAAIAWRLYDGVSRGDIREIQMMLRHGASPTAEVYRLSALQLAVEEGRLDIVEMLLGRTPASDVDVHAEYTNPAVTIAIEKQRGDIAALLKTHGSQVDKSSAPAPGKI